MRTILLRFSLLLLLVASFMTSCDKDDEAVNPDICFEVTEGELFAEMTIGFDATCSPGTFEQYTWDFGDGDTGTGAQTSHVYDEPGQYTVVLSAGNYGEPLRSINKKINILASPFIKHCDDIEGDEVWEEGMHLVNCDITVNGSLTIKPGAAIYMGSERSLDIAGKLIAQGTASKPIKFLPADNSTTPGAWGHIRFSSTASAESILDHCEIRYGGEGSLFFYPHFEYPSTYGTIQLEECEVSITNTTVEGAAAYGINLTENARFKSFENNTITGSTKNPLRIYVAALPTIGKTSTFAGEKDILAVSLQYLSLAGDVTWYKQDVPYHLDGRIDLLGNYGITIEAGTVLKLTSERLSDNAYINTGNGSLKAIGTAAEPIIFTSAEAEKKRGDWGGLLVSSNSILQHCVIEYAGAEYKFGYHRNVTLSGTAVLENSLIQEGLGMGIQVAGSEATVRNNTIKNCNRAGVDIEVTDHHAVDVSNILENTEGFHIGGSMNSDVTLTKRPYPYICSGITLWNATLTIEPGTTIEMRTSASITMGYNDMSNSYSGNLVANGTADAPITFSLWTKDKQAGTGNWGAIYFGETSTSSVLNHCILSDGGNGGAITSIGIINCYKTTGFPSITNCTMSNSSSYGIALRSGSTITTSGNTFLNNASGDVYTE